MNPSDDLSTNKDQNQAIEQLLFTLADQILVSVCKKKMIKNLMNNADATDTSPDHCVASHR